MALSIREELHQTFALATMQREARHLKTSEHWNKANEIMQRCDRLRENEKRLFRDFYDTRVDAAQRRLIDAAGDVRREFRPTHARIDRFHSDLIRRQAHREVNAAHHRKLLQISRLEFQNLEGVVHQTERANTLRDKVRTDFHRAVDRRQAVDRRRKSGPS